LLLSATRREMGNVCKESMVAEKLESMVKLGVINSRLNDFFDVWLLSQQFDFDGQTLAKAIEKTFSKRGTDIPSEPTALTPNLH